MMTKYFLDVPVYRVTSSEYYSRRDQDITKGLDESWRGLNPTEEQLKAGRASREDHFYKRYGPWDFNEIIGHIRLYLLGSQIRGEYFSAEKTRTGLGRTRVFTFESLKLAAERNLWGGEDSNAEILSAIHEYLDRCQDELRKGRHIDRRTLNTLGPHIDWRSLFERNQLHGGAKK